MQKTGEPFVLQKDGESLEILGIGHIGDRKQRPHGEFIQEYERQTLRRFIKDCLKNKHDPDLLITHDQPTDSQSGYGAEEIADVLDQLAFAYYFTGTRAKHTGRTWRTEALPCRSKSKNWNLTDRASCRKAVC